MPGIVFEPLDAFLDGAAGEARLRLSSAGLGFSLAVGSGAGKFAFALGSAGYGDTTAVAPEEPAVPGAGFAVLVLSSAGEGYQLYDAQGSATLALGSLGYGGDPDYGGGAATLALSTFGMSFPDEYPYFMLVEPFPIISGYGGAWFNEIDEAFSLTDNAASLLIYLVSASLTVSANPSVMMKFIALVQDNLTLRDAVSLVFQHEVLADVTLAEQNEANYRLIVSVVDQLMLEDETLLLANALLTVAVALVLRDEVVPVWQNEVSDELSLTEAQENQVLALVQVLEDLILTDEIEHSLALFAVVEDGFELTDDASLLLALLGEVSDELSLGVRVRIGDDVFVGYVVNTVNAAVSEYDNYPFNSFATIAGRPYGASAQGIYRLDGDDDAGDPIAAFVRTGAMDFGSLSKVPNAWIYLNSDGSMVFKTITMDAGSKKENWYRMKARPLGEAAESRFDIAKGLTSNYWQFELANEDGAYFELSAVKIYPVRMSRRYSGR